MMSQIEKSYASTQGEAGVTGIDGLPALLQVSRQTSGISQHLALFARDIRAHVPRLRTREQSRIG